MRPMKLALALAAVAALLPAVSLAQPFTCAEQGGFLFVDKKSFEFNTSCSDADVSYCLSGRDNPIDATVFPNRLVQFDWFSDGSVTKSSDSATKGEFSSVTLTLTIIAIRGPTAEPFPPRGNCTLWQSETTSFPCKLKGGTQKSNTKSRVRLLCELGENLSGLVPAAGFGPLSDVPLTQPTSPQTLLQSVESAFLKRKGMKLDVKTGKLKVIQKGVGAPTGFQSDPNACAFSPGSCLLCPALPPDPSLTTPAPLCPTLP